MYDNLLFQDWALENDGSSLLDDMTKALDEVGPKILLNPSSENYSPMWSQLQVMKLNECEIYGYNPDFDGDPFLEKGAM